MIEYVLERAKEASTWRGVVVLLTAIGVGVTPELQTAIISFGLGAAGLIGVIFKDKVKK